MKILILGAGALGSNVTKFLAIDLRGEHEITVLDYDTVEERNVQAGTQFYLREQKGLHKTEALQYNIYKQYGRKIEILDGKFEHLFKATTLPYDLVIDCFDNKEARSMARVHTNTKKTALLHAGFSNQFTFSVQWDENYETPDNEVKIDICEMPGAASWIAMVSSVVSLAVQEFIKSGEKMEFIGNKFSVRPLT